MKHLALYRLICEGFARQGSAVSTRELRDAITISDASFYNLLNDLIAAQYVERVMRGWVMPNNIYQWTMEDYGMVIDEQ